VRMLCFPFQYQAQAFMGSLLWNQKTFEPSAGQFVIIERNTKEFNRVNRRRAWLSPCFSAVPRGAYWSPVRLIIVILCFLIVSQILLELGVSPVVMRDCPLTMNLTFIF
jgi:hypothetical protein